MSERASMYYVMITLPQFVHYPCSQVADVGCNILWTSARYYR